MRGMEAKYKRAIDWGAVWPCLRVPRSPAEPERVKNSPSTRPPSGQFYQESFEPICMHTTATGYTERRVTLAINIIF